MQEEIRESTSIKIKPSVWKKAKLESISDDIELSQYVENAVTFWNKKGEQFRKTKGEKCLS